MPAMPAARPPRYTRERQTPAHGRRRGRTVRLNRSAPSPGHVRGMQMMVMMLGGGQHVQLYAWSSGVSPDLPILFAHLLSHDIRDPRLDSRTFRTLATIPQSTPSAITACSLTTWLSLGNRDSRSIARRTSIRATAASGCACGRVRTRAGLVRRVCLTRRCVSVLVQPKQHRALTACLRSTAPHARLRCAFPVLDSPRRLRVHCPTYPPAHHFPTPFYATAPP